MTEGDPKRMRLVVARGQNRGKVFYIEEGNNLLGRWDPDTGSFPEIDLEDEDVDAKISRKHAIVERRGSSATLADAGSLNGTYLNRSDRLKEGEPQPLSDGDEIIVGKIFMTFFQGEESS